MTHKILFILLQTKDEYPKKYTVTTRAWALGLSDVWVVGWAYTQGGGVISGTKMLLGISMCMCKNLRAKLKMKVWMIEIDQNH